MSYRPKYSFDFSRGPVTRTIFYEDTNNMETIHLYNLSNLCRVCLSKTDEMSDLFDESKDLCNLFRKFVNIELEKNETLPNYLCSICEEKILICQDFINQCKKTNDLLEKYKECDFKNEQEDTKLCLESVPVTEIVQFIANDDTSNDSKICQIVDNGICKNQRKSRLKQFSNDEVMQVIEEEKKKFSAARNCCKCNFRARNFRSLSLHISFVHKEIKENWCSTCNAVFDDLKQHSGTHQNNENNCQFCGKTFSVRGHFLQHLLSHATIRPYKCDVCDKSFVNTKNLRVHNKIHTREKQFVCNYCTSSFLKLNQLKTHLKKDHENGSETRCIYCKYVFETDDQLRKHECTANIKQSDMDVSTNIYLGKQNYCTICGKNVRSLTIHNKNVHETVESDEYNTMKLCTVCGKQFKSFSKLEVHMRIHTGETPYNCSYCDRKMATRNLLVTHERTHTGERPYICHVCNKSFTQSSILNTHMKLHTGRPEICMLCGKKFCRPAELRLHMRKHTGEKPFVCSYCGKSFIQRSHLVEHTKRHTDDKPFKCAHCDKSFRQRSSLKTHVQIHLGEKPFKCSQCPYACRQSYSLTIHMAKHSDDAPRLDRPHSCDYCTKTFTTMAMLNSHLANVHMTVCIK